MFIGNAISVTNYARDNEDGFTSRELAEKFGLTQSWAQSQLRKLQRTGKLVCIGSRYTEGVDGRPARSPVYKLTGEQ